MTDYIVPEDQQEDWEGFSGSQTEIEDQSLHPATLVALERKILPSQFDPTGFAPAIIWTFALEDIEGTTVDGTSSEATGPKSKARPWLEALLGKAQTAALLRGRIDKSALIGRQALVLVAINDNGYPKVANVLPAQKARSTNPNQTVQPDVTIVSVASQKAPPSPATPEVAPSTTPAPVAAPEPSDGVCEAFSAEFGRCERDSGHGGLHRNKDKETWHATN